MHPAKSVIFFTTTSGAGYGLLIVAVLFEQLGWINRASQLWPVILITALLLVTAGLISSSVHLGHPERAWRALSQWRTSWLSREGVLALLAYAPWVANLGLWWIGERGVLFTASAILAALLAVATLYSTSMIYRTLKPVAAWHNGFVAPGYLLLGLVSGLAILSLLVHLAGGDATRLVFILQIGLVATLVFKRLYWRFIDRTPGLSTLQSATGLSGASVSVLDQPHSGDNYLLKEMGFKIARKHSLKLRDMCSLLLLGGVIAFAMMGALGASPGGWLAGAGVGLSLGAIFIERWLFFAEAKHAQALYYGH
jgi:sulfite dehydrogenase (quinone) subunit SoeC